MGQVCLLDASETNLLDDYGQIVHRDEPTPRGAGVPVELSLVDTEEDLLALSAGMLAAKAPAATRAIYELLCHEDALSRETGLASLAGMLTDGWGKETGMNILQTSLLVLQRIPQSEAAKETATAALELIRKAGQLLVQVSVPEVVLKKPDSATSSFAAFVMRVRIGADLGVPESLQCHQVERRYSDFDTLRTHAVNAGENIWRNEDLRLSVDALEFPPKRMFGNTKPDVMELRRKVLDAWISGIAAMPAVASQEQFAKFLGIP
jgi:hypothetical protein